MKTLKDIYWNNYKGYRGTIGGIPQADKPLSYWGGLRLIGCKTETYPEILTDQLNEAMIWNKKLVEQEAREKLHTDLTQEVQTDGHKRRGFIRRLFSIW